MIKIDYTENEIKIETTQISDVYNNPSRLCITSTVSGEEVWCCELYDNQWATFPTTEMNDVKIYDNDDVIIHKKWSAMEYGSFLYKKFYLVLKKLSKLKKVKGLAVGTHDGKFGEWVPAVREGLTESFLVEASKPQFEELNKHYNHLDNVKLYNRIMSVDGSEVEFFEGGKGYTNSIVERVIRKWETEDITKKVEKSYSLNHFISEEMGGEIDWLHLDIEGYDAKLLMSMDKKMYNLPKMILFEHENLKEDEKKMVKKFLINNSYNVECRDVSCICLKK